MASAALMPAKTGKLLQFDPNEPLVIGVDTNDGPEHELWDERTKLPLTESMVCNIMVLGIKEPVVLRKSMAHEGKYEVVDGRGRILHGREANKRLKKAGEPLIYAPAVLENGDEVHMASVSIALNEIRREDNTITKAEKCMRLLQRNGNDHKAAAVTFGVSVAAIKQWVKVAELTPKVKRAVAAGEISASAAAELHGLDRIAQMKKLDKLIGEAKTNGRKRTTLSKVKKETGRRVAVPKRVLLKLVEDRAFASGVSADMLTGIKLALGAYVPSETTKLGKLLAQVGFKYE